MPALVPPIGALCERIAESGAGWVMTEDEWHDEDRMLDRIVALLSPPAATDACGRFGPRPRRAGHDARGDG